MPPHLTFFDHFQTDFNLFTPEVFGSALVLDPVVVAEISLFLV